MLMKLSTALGVGMAAHRLRPYIQGLPEGARDISSYTIGSLVVFAMTLFIHDEDRSWPVAHLLALGAVGAGVVAGWVKDAFQPGEIPPLTQ